MIKKILIKSKVKLDKNGIWVTNLKLSSEVQTSKKAWERIYNFNLNKLKEDREDFDQNKLMDHLGYIKKSFKFNKNSIYLEIGCGPAHIGEYILKHYGSYFIGVDFNYPMLLTLKKYFDERGYKKYMLIHADINNMPIRDNSIDYIYGGGVIEHFPDTRHILKESYRILKKGGVSFNTVPAFNLWWILRFYSNIPSPILLRKIFEFIHIKILKGKLLEKNSGYELGFTKKELLLLHKNIGFKKIFISPFAFHPSKHRLKNELLRESYYKIQKNILLSAVYYVRGVK